jgi:predicted nucleotidyltransferase
MKFVDEKTVEAVVEQLVETLQPETIILFGSYADGRADFDSDIDILALTDRRFSPVEQYELQRRLFADFPFAVQLILMTAREFEETKNVIGGIAYPAAKYGKIIYERG